MSDSHASLPRRRGRQPAAHRPPQGSACQASARRRSATISSRRSKTRRSRRSSASRRMWACSSPPTASSAAPGGISTFFWHLTGCERVVLDHGIQFHGTQDQAREPAGDGQAGFPRRPSDARAFQVLASQHQADAEDDDPLAVGDAFPRRARRHQPSCLSRHGRLLRRPGQALRQGHQGVLRLPAAAICSSTTRCGPICAPRSRWRRRAPAARTPTGLPASTPDINTALKEKPADMTITTHVCRGNFRSTWISEGGYEPVAELLLGGVDLRWLFPRVRHRTRRRAGAAALPAQGQEARRGGPRHLQERQPGEKGRHQAAAR